MTNVLLEELVLAVKANDADSFKGWLYEGLQELGEPVLTGLVLNVMLPSLSTAENDAARERANAFVESGWGAVDWSELVGDQ